MKLVLLPGLDGTGNLFAPILPFLTAFDCYIIKLPERGKQDYPSLTKYVKQKLPCDDFILLAESFSGPIGAALAVAGIENLRAVVFVATFLSVPRPRMLRMFRVLPLKLLTRLPFAALFYKWLLLGPQADDELILLFKNTITGLSSSVIRARLKAIDSLPPLNGQSDLPVIYIEASSDKLVPNAKTATFETYFSRTVWKKIKGPHFILQARPEECAKAILQVMPLIRGTSEKSTA